jgi:hypothetical protein
MAVDIRSGRLRESVAAVAAAKESGVRIAQRTSTAAPRVALRAHASAVLRTAASSTAPRDLPSYIACQRRTKLGAGES